MDKKQYIIPTASVMKSGNEDVLTTSLLFERYYDGDTVGWKEVF